MTADPVLRCEDVSKSWGRRTVLSGCTINVQPGEVVGLVGENGAGKTTLLRCLMGFERPSRGVIQLGGRVGYCPQETFLHASYTAREHLELACAIYRRRAAVDASHVNDLVERFRLTTALDQRMGTLSGGTRQKVKFLTAILHAPTLLLMDEPYDGFDWETYLLFWDVLREMRAAGAAALLVTHFVHDRTRLNRLHELRDGVLHAA
jgi:ABC-2 type transport system ATP-binding protein